VKKVDTAIVKLWGDVVGAVSWLDTGAYAIFEYEPGFLKKGLDVSPIHMSLDDAQKGDGRFSFPNLNKETFLGLPGLLADALPDKFGNSIIDAWLARNGRHPDDFSPIERLCYTNQRGMGALEFSPALIGKYDTAVPLEISELVNLTQSIIKEHKKLKVKLNSAELDHKHAIRDLLRVGTSAGGARPKAIIAINNQGHVMSGQTKAPHGYDDWLLKFDGVTDQEMKDTKGYGRIEYAYHLMAKAAGIQMTECRLLEENGRAHFMTKRFDRIAGKKLHMQSLCGIAHYDFNRPGAYSYEQAFAVMRQLRLPKTDAIEQYRRMVFNVIARNLDDHTKNISFLMGLDGKWRLSPAYDVNYAYNPSGKWTHQHQMSLNGKCDHFTIHDLLHLAASISMTKAPELIQNIIQAVEHWPVFAKQAGVDNEIILEIAKCHLVGKNALGR